MPNICLFYSQITSSIRDTSVNGLEGLNIKVAAPFRFRDYIFGFKYSLSDLRNAPEQLFAKRSVDTNVGRFTLDTDYTISNHNVGVAAKWSNDPLGLSVGVNADTQSKLKNVGVSKSLVFRDSKVYLNAAIAYLQASYPGG